MRKNKPTSVVIFLDENVPHFTKKEIYDEVADLVSNLKIFPHPHLLNSNATLDFTVVQGVWRIILLLNSFKSLFIFLTFDGNFIDDAKEDLDHLAAHPRLKTAQAHLRIKNKIQFDSAHKVITFSKNKNESMVLHVLFVEKEAQDEYRSLLKKIINRLKSFLSG